MELCVCMRTHTQIVERLLEELYTKFTKILM